MDKASESAVSLVGHLLYGGHTDGTRLLYLTLWTTDSTILWCLATVAKCLLLKMTRRASQFWNDKLVRRNALDRLYASAGMTRGFQVNVFEWRSKLCVTISS